MEDNSNQTSKSADQITADAFSKSWNNLPLGSVYSAAQFEDWLDPITEAEVKGARVAELGCGGASLLCHMVSWKPRELIGVDLGESVKMAERNMAATGFASYEIIQGDLQCFKGQNFDVVYCIGVLHHLKEPENGFKAVLRATRGGGRFHCWVYAHEGNRIVRWFVDPIRKVVSSWPWWLVKYAVATPLAIPFFFYAKALKTLPTKVLSWLPLYSYSLWIAAKDFSFFRHVAFDQLVTPQTIYFKKQVIESWLDSTDVDPGSAYLIFRNGNSWKFGGKRRAQ
jgi:SAM-dependent methyltransferase